MAKIQRVEEALQRWAAMVGEGRDGSGFPTMSVLHPNWSPPTPGQTPTLKVARSSAELERVHEAIRAMTLRSRNTLVVHYCQRLSLEQQGSILGCQPKTVLERIGTIHRQLLALLESESK